MYQVIETGYGIVGYDYRMHPFGNPTRSRAEAQRTLQELLSLVIKDNGIVNPETDCDYYHSSLEHFEIEMSYDYHIWADVVYIKEV